jgi:hypothetical protein
VRVWTKIVAGNGLQSYSEKDMIDAILFFEQFSSR